MTDSSSTHRLTALDALRGLIIIVMALDHANGLVARAKLDPEMWTGMFPNYGAQGALFLTRFVTHLAAPGFFFLMGAGMVLFQVSRMQRGWPAIKVAGHFLVRGLLLILLQFMLENPAWALGGVIGETTYVGVLFALGAGMVIGTVFIWLPWQAGLGWILLCLFQGFLLARNVRLTSGNAGRIQARSCEIHIGGVGRYRHLQKLFYPNL